MSASSRFQRTPVARAKIFPWGAATKGIWNADDPVYYETPRNRYSYFRRSFILKHRPETANFKILVDTRYKLYCNGKYVGRGPSRFDVRNAYYDVYELAPHLAAGKNVIAVFAICHGYGTGSAASVMQILIAQLEYGEKQRPLQTIGSDQDWKAKSVEAYEREVPRLNGRQGPMEVVNLERLDAHWCRPDYDDSGWKSCAILRSDLNNTPWFNFFQRDIPPLQENESEMAVVCDRGTAEFPAPAAIKLGGVRPAPNWETSHAPIVFNDQRPLVLGGAGENRAAVLNVDFGQTLTGYLKMVVCGARGDVVDVLYTEVLSGRNVPLPLHSRIATDRFILKEGENCCEVSFGWKGFRYAQLWVWSARPVSIISIKIGTIGYPVQGDGVFRSKDRRIDGIIAISALAVRVCMQDGHLDSPSREQQQWTDCWRQAQAAAYYFGDTLLWRRLLVQICQSQDSTGALFPRHPGRHENVSIIPLFMCYWVESLDEYVRHTGDDELLKELWPNVVQVLRWFSAFENGAGLLEAVPHWMFIDWGDLPDGPAPEIFRDGIVTALNIAYYRALQTGAQLAHQVGDDEAGRYFATKSERLAPEIDRAAWDESLGAYVDSLTGGNKARRCSGATNVFALQFLPMDGRRAASVIDHIFEHPIPESCSCSPGYTLELNRALRRFNREDLCLRLIREKFGRMVDAGATTTWEVWNIFEPGGSRVWSASHGFGGAGVLMFFVESIIGARLLPATPSGRRYRFAPKFRLIPEFYGRIFLPDGLVELEWQWSNERLKFKFSTDFPIEGELSLAEAGDLPLRARIELDQTLKETAGQNGQAPAPI